MLQAPESCQKMAWSPSYEHFFLDSMKFLSTFFCPKMTFLNFRRNWIFLRGGINAPFDLSWGSRRLISFTYQKRCFMTTFRFWLFFAIFEILGRLFPGWKRLSDGYSGFRIEYSRFRMSIPRLEWVFPVYNEYSRFTMSIPAPPNFGRFSNPYGLNPQNSLIFNSTSTYFFPKILKKN